MKIPLGVSGVATVLVFATMLHAGQQPPSPRNGTPAAPKPTAPPVKTTGAPPPDLPAGAPLPPDYVIGVEDILTVFFWREKDITGDVQVRPDGRISIPLLNDLDAAGLTPEQLRVRITEAAAKFLESPTVTVVVKQINSRRVYITGAIAKPGPYPLGGPTSIMQLIATAGGVNEYADSENVTIIRTENGKQSTFRFNYSDVKRGRNLQQNILLKPGDTIVIP